MLGDIEDGIFIVRTFITYDMATGLQREEFAKAQGKLFDIEGEIEYSHKFLKHQNLITT